MIFEEVSFVSFGTRSELLHNLINNKIDLKKQILQAI